MGYARVNVKSFIGNAMFFAALMLIIARFLSVWAGTPFPIDLVSAQSMNPTLMEGDVIAWTPASIEDVEIGDVVVFRSYLRWPDEKLVIHRVSNILYDSKGDPILETKGDANEWVDQAGPHIPEPYIREDHFLGKAISIGKQPLKIPLVGYLGIWVNDGLSKISQPTASKGSLEYVGIFAPLTISIIILIILIVVVPEKARTIKEKIKLYIFGSRPLSLKKTFIQFFLLYLIFFTFIHIFAYDSVTASVGINDECPESSMGFGRIKQGTESFRKYLPVYNPSIMPLKGVVFGRGEVNEYINRDIFELRVGEGQTTTVYADAKNTSKNGSYLGEIMVYSSPFWIMFPDDLMKSIVEFNADITVFTLDFLTALILTTLTAGLLVVITFLSDKYTQISIDLSWHHVYKLLIKEKTKTSIILTGKKVKRAIGKNIGWITNINLTEISQRETSYQNYIKPVIASILFLPVLVFITDAIGAMILSAILAGFLAYFISCKIRRKIVLTTFITMCIATVHMIIQSNMMIFNKTGDLLEIMALSLGAMSVYLILLSLLLIPLAFLSWLLTRQIRNLKERKEPLLVLEGQCDL